MSPTPEKADPDVCPSTSAFPGEPTYRCSIAGWHPHTLHDDGEHHRWFDAIPDLPIATWQADLLEAVRMLAENIQMPQHYWPETPASRLDEALRSQQEFVAGLASVTQTPPIHYNEDDVRPHYTSPRYPYPDPPKRPVSFAETLPVEACGTGEVRTTSSTGGQKGTKPARFDLIPVMPLTRLAEHYGVGAAKYADHNWRKGYELSKNYAALQRHVTAFWDGEDLDPETGTPHLSAVIFHAMAMQQNLQDFPQHDDRYKKEA